MFGDSKRLNHRDIIFSTSLVLITLLLSFVLVQIKPIVVLAIGCGIFILIVSFISTEVTLYILIFSMLLGPEIILGETAGRADIGRGVSLRLDDILLVIIGFSWFAKTAIYKELGLFLKTPLNKPIACYVAVCLFSTVIGMMYERVEIKTGFFFVLKYIEYFIVYFMVVNNIRNKRQIRMFILAMLITCAIVSIIAILQIPGGGRVTAPFEGEVGEPNTLGGYLVLILSIVAGLFLTTESRRNKIFLGLLSILVFMPFLATQSRSSYLAIVPLYFTLLILSKKKIGLILTMIVFITLGIFFMPSTVKDRIAYTFTQLKHSGQMELGGIRIDTSTSNRLRSWKDVITKDWIKHPILGHGITGYRFLDAQYPRVLAETGLLGLAAFFWLIYSLFTVILKTYQNTRDRFHKGLSLGFLAGLVAMLAHAIGANTFIIVRIMEPFWFLAGIVMMVPALEMGKKEKQ